MIAGMILRNSGWRLFLLFAFAAGAAQPQWLNYREPGVPRLRDGKVNMTAPAPRTADGKPDLSGVWMHETTTAAEMKRLYGKVIEEAQQVDAPGMEIGTQHKYFINIFLDLGPDSSYMRPEAVAQMRRNQAVNNLADACTPGASMGFPLADLVSEPIKIVQAPRLMMILYEAGNFSRQIHTDGRVLPKEFDLPAFNGYSAGHWEGDTLVVETAGFNNKTWLDGMRHPHSDALHVTERFRRVNFGHLDYEIRFEDPKMYTKPFAIKVPHELEPDSDIFENYCENEKDSAHLPAR
jgi:hypothetical protein